MKKRKNTLTLVVLSPIIILMVFIYLAFLSQIGNNIALNGFAKQLTQYPLPENTHLVSIHKTCGKLNGNGNGMDFFAGALVKSELSLEEIKKHYDSISFKNARRSGEYRVIVEVSEVDSFIFTTKYLEREIIFFEELENFEDLSKYFLVAIYDGGYPAGFDIRAN